MLNFTESVLGYDPKIDIKANINILNCVQNFSLCLESKLENNPVENNTIVSTLLSEAKIDTGESKFPGNTLKILFGFHCVQRYFCQYNRKPCGLPDRPFTSFLTIAFLF